MRQPLIYALHSGELYGTERMALVTAEGLRENYNPIIFAPKGKALVEAQRLGFETESFATPSEFAFKLRHFLAQSPNLAFIATGLVHSLSCIAWNIFYRRKLTHLHVIHGGTDEKLSYGRKRLLNHTNVIFVAVSKFVRQRLIANGVEEKQIVVVENFLPNKQIIDAPKRPRFDNEAVRRVLVVSRLDPIKRVDLLLDTLDEYPELSGLEFRIVGTGSEAEKLQQRASRNNPNVTFAGYVKDVAQELASSDLLLHLCHVEPFGLAILEAMAARLPVLVPDQGGASSIIEEAVSGFHFRANSTEDLANKLKEISLLSAEKLNSVSELGLKKLVNQFSANSRINDYKYLLKEGY
ncbi:MAG: glycosyltransferase family 4 protein [Blastocatellia bacterium]|nr:glycosyltransferase family 4 protein [Blastocatellia bacterium]